MRWLLAPFGALAVTILAMLLSGVVTLPVSVALSAGVLAYARRRPASRRASRGRRDLGLALAGLVALWTWALVFERPGARDVPIDVPAVVLLALIVAVQASGCVGLLRAAPPERSGWHVLAGLLLWAGLSVGALAYELHRGAVLGAL